MATQRNRNGKRARGGMIRVRVPGDLKERLTRYRTRVDVQRTESSLVRLAVKGYLDEHEAKAEITKP